MANNETETKFMTLKSDFSEFYTFHKYKWLRFCFFDNLPLEDLTKADSGNDLLNFLEDIGAIASDDVHLLSEVANLSCLKKAKRLITQYMSDGGQNTARRKHLSDYRKRLFEALRNVGLDEKKGIISHYHLKCEFETTWDVVFYLEKQELLQDNPEKIQRFADRLNKKARNHLLGIIVKVPIPIGKRKTEDPEDQPSPNEVLALCYDKLQEIESYLSYLGCCEVIDLTTGSVVFYVSLVDPRALTKIWKLHQNGQLLKDIAEILCTDKHRQEFEQNWETQFDQQVYKEALDKLNREGRTISNSKHRNAVDTSHNENIFTTINKMLELITKAEIHVDLNYLDLGYIRHAPLDLKDENKEEKCFVGEVFLQGIGLSLSQTGYGLF